MGCTGALGKCGTFSQILVFMVNTFLFVGSILLVTGSVLELQTDNAIVQFIDVNNPNQVAYIGICVGSVTAFISFFGCAGSCSQSKFIIKLYLVMMLILFILFLTIILMGFLYQRSLGGNLTNGMEESLSLIRHGSGNDTEKLMKNWNAMQEKWSCCGVTSYNNWDFDLETSARSHQEEDISTDIPEEDLKKIPTSCFINNTKVEDNLYRDGCNHKGKESLKGYITLILIASGAVAIILVFSICISLWLLRSVKKSLAFN